MTDSLALPTTWHDWLPWLLVLLLAFWGGLVQYFSRVRRKKLPFSALELVGDMAMSGFVGFLVYFATLWLKIDFLLAIIFVGMAAHLGSRSLFVFELFSLRKGGVPEEIIEQLVEPPSALPFGPSKPRSGPGAGASE
jgi:hypothetical protein